MEAHVALGRCPGTSHDTTDHIQRLHVVKTNIRARIGDPVPLLPFAAATLVLLGACLGGAVTVSGDIKDDGIALATQRAGANVQIELRNIGTKPCDLVVALTSLTVAALPLKDGQVVIVDGDGPGIVRPITTYEYAPTFILGRIEPGAVFHAEVALEGAPKTDDRVILCNGVGDYQHGRYAVLRFDR